MIRTDAEYRLGAQKLKESSMRLEQYRAALESKGYTATEVENGMNPLRSFQEQLQEELDWYDNVRRGNLGTITRLTDIGKLLIGLRIYHGHSQRVLAELLGVSEALVSRDERNEYHGITVDRAQRIVDAMQAHVTTYVAEDDGLPHHHGNLVGV